MIRIDLLALLTPLTFGGYSSTLKKALDRSIGLISPFFRRIDGEVHYHRRYRRYPRLLAVAVADRAEGGRLFETIVARNALNLHCPTHRALVVDQGLEDPRFQRQLRGATAAIEEAR